MKILLLLISFLSVMSVAEARVEVREFSSPKEEQRYKTLVNELRCLVCQNQNLADSNAPLAQDLRKQVYKMISAGQSDKDIQDFMVTRYGEFVLYNPPLNATTFLLWTGPFIILIVGLYILITFIRRRKTITVSALTDEDKEQLKELLDNKD